MSKKRRVALVNPNCGGNYVQSTYRGREHLGLGYLAAELGQVGISSQIIDSRIMSHKPKEAAEQILEIEPSIVAFSLIAKDATSWTEEVIGLVHQQYEDTHFVAGNYFPTLQPQRAFDSMPSLDSIVIGEGDITFPEMAQAIQNGDNWKKLKGVAYRDEDGKVVINPRRPLIQNLDDLPIPVHTAHQYGLKEFAIRGADGCYMKCTFCSIYPFFNKGENPIKWRPRSPKSIAAEMAMLQESHPDIKVVRFVDPDSIGAPIYENRILELAFELRTRGVHQDWIIDTRTAVINGVSDDTWDVLRQSGLREVFLGVETTDPVIKEMMDKRTTFEQDQRAIEKLTRHDIRARYGFMMITPWTTEENLPDNAKKISQLGLPRLDKFFQEMFVVPGTRAEEIVGKTHDLWFDFKGEGEYYSYNLPQTVGNLRTLARTLVSNNQVFLEAHLRIYEQVKSLFEGPVKATNAEACRDQLNQLSLSVFMELFNSAKENAEEITPDQAVIITEKMVTKFGPILDKAQADLDSNQSI